MSVSATHCPTRHAQELGAPDKKPLYLSALRPISVEGSQDSLVIRQEQRAPQRIPLSRIDRIVCRGNTRWSSSAISQCCAAGIPIIWLDGRGECIGSTLPQRAPRTALESLLERYAALPGWCACFEIWLTRRRLETLTDWAMRAARAGHAPDPHEFELLKREYVYKGTHAQVFPAQGLGWCQALVVSRLDHDGLRPRYWGYQGSSLALADALAGLLWAELNFDAGTLAAATEDGALSARLFESWSHARAFRIAHHLADLNRHAAAELEAWQ